MAKEVLDKNAGAFSVFPGRLATGILAVAVLQFSSDRAGSIGLD
jgi:hypothetical protein